MRQNPIRKVSSDILQEHRDASELKCPLTAGIGALCQTLQSKELRASREGTDSGNTPDVNRETSTRSPAVLQAKEMRAAIGPQRTKQVAKEGLIGTPQKFPHLEKIQPALGGNDLSNVQAYVGGPAAKAAETMGASAYAMGDKVAFKAHPDVATAAHEAAHVVQQRAGISLKDGIGQAGDHYERQADQVAGGVAAGRSTASQLDQLTGGATGETSTVQRHGVEQDTESVDKNEQGDQVQLKIDPSELGLGAEFSKDGIEGSGSYPFWSTDFYAPIAGTPLVF